MMVTQKEVRRVAALARLRIDEGECERWCEHMEAIIGFADKLNELDLDKKTDRHRKKPTVYNVFREDVTGESYLREDMLANAPEQYEGCYVVPKIME